MIMRTLFYEDLKTINFDELAQLSDWYDEFTLLETRHYRALNQNILCYAEEQSSDTIEQLEELLKERGYVFKHKQNREETQQRNSNLLKVIRDDDSYFYLFLEVAYQAIEG